MKNLREPINLRENFWDIWREIGEERSTCGSPVFASCCHYKLFASLMTVHFLICNICFDGEKHYVLNALPLPASSKTWLSNRRYIYNRRYRKGGQSVGGLKGLSTWCAITKERFKPFICNLKMLLSAWKIYSLIRFTKLLILHIT